MLLLEGKLLVSSRQANVVTEVCESLLALLFPFQWVNPYVPRVIEGMQDVIDAPGPVLMGVEDLSIPLEAQVFMGTIGVRPKCLLEKITQVWGLRYIVCS